MNLLSGVNQDHHRPQSSPGGYEWWHFDGSDEKNDLSFSLRFSAGNLFSAYYQDNLKAYWQKTKSPLTGTSQNVTPPPNPLDYCGVSFQVFHQGSLIGETIQEFSSSFLKASDQQGAVLLGANRFNWDISDPPSYIITVQSPLKGNSAVLRARLFFTPLTSGVPQLPQSEFPSTHTWILTAPLCHVEGTLQWCDPSGDVKKERVFVGKGYHDHHFGSVPLDRFVENWHWGRTFVGDKTLVYSAQTFAHKNENPEGILLVFDQNKLESVQRGLPVRSSRKGHNFFWLPYSKLISFPENSLEVDHDTILNNGPVHLIFKDKVKWKTETGLFQGVGLSNYLHTPRLSNSFFFPMIKSQSTLYTRQQTLSVPPLDPQGGVSTERPE